MEGLNAEDTSFSPCVRSFAGAPSVAICNLGASTSCLGNLIQNQDFGRRKIWILKRKSRFGFFRYRWIRILGSRSGIQEKFIKKTDFEINFENLVFAI